MARADHHHHHRTGGARGTQQGPDRRTNQGRPSDTASVEMEMWPLCYVHTAPPAVFRVHSLPLARGSQNAVHTLPLPKHHSAIGYPVSQSHFLTLPASYVVGNAHCGVRMDVRGPKRYPVSTMAGFEVIVSVEATSQLRQERLMSTNHVTSLFASQLDGSNYLCCDSLLSNVESQDTCCYVIIKMVSIEFKMQRLIHNLQFHMRILLI